MINYFKRMSRFVGGTPFATHEFYTFRLHFDRVIRVSIPIVCRPATSMRRNGSPHDVSASIVCVRTPPRTYRRAPSKLYFASSNMASRQPEQSLQATTAALIADFQSRIADRGLGAASVVRAE